MYEELSNEYLECSTGPHPPTLRKTEKELVQGVKVVADEVGNLSWSFAFPVERSEDGGECLLPRFPLSNKIPLICVSLNAFNQNAEVLLDPFRTGPFVPQNMAYSVGSDGFP
jgi:hypothetical protein